MWSISSIYICTCANRQKGNQSSLGIMEHTLSSLVLGSFTFGMFIFSINRDYCENIRIKKLLKIPLKFGYFFLFKNNTGFQIKN